ncbi:MAG: DEAD/DEAH box helicase [Gemmatimonadota bacterium]|nr:DEAD/DEAH box helicase [Gemmatimonadota bacterium]
MTVDWTFDDRIHLLNERISAEDARRQTQAAAEILRRFARQPGVILADEVGMGKTFVALAVGVSILLERSRSDPIVVMSPSTLRDKWPKDWEVFRQLCLDSSVSGDFRAARADSGVEFLRLLDDPDSSRAHFIFLTHGALHRTIGDGFAKLAVIKRAFKGRSSLAVQRRSFARHAGKLLRLEWVEQRAPGLLGDLLDRPYDSWLRTIHRADKRLKENVTDDPVPAHLVDVLESMSSVEFEPLVEALRYLPQRGSKGLVWRLQEARRGISDAMENVWKVALRQISFRSPLLILDEAHHVKNPGTRLASLFASVEAAEESDVFKTAGPLGGKFERMLFLTATPFQLGHAELVRVLERFEGVAWSGPGIPTLSRDQYRGELVQLGKVLDDAQASALRLDRSWGRLETRHFALADGSTVDTVDIDKWWLSAQLEQGEGLVAQLVHQVKATKEVMEKAESALSPWVLRYMKSTHLPDQPSIDRRLVLNGAAIQDGGSSASGLEIPGSVVLPFLLAGRAQALMALTPKGRALFAEGLASSFEAYLETRAGREVRDDDEDSSTMVAAPDLEWYLKHLDAALPEKDRTLRFAHPKIRATAERAVELWRRGDKVLIFCFYRATGRALRQHISSLLNDEIAVLGQAKLPGLSPREVHKFLNEMGDRFFDDDALRTAVTDWLHPIVSQFEAFSPDQTIRVADVIRRFIRTPSFLVRYMPLQTDDVASEFLSAADDATEEQQSLRRRIEDFCRFLSERCISSERDEFLAALESVQTGSHLGKEVRAVFDPGEATSLEEGKAMLLPNVRLANGEVRSETRRRLLLTFNTPLFPEILIASSVMAEGVDLHLHCRHVIHHDLCWNPSTLEQRSGRVDRIGCKAERVGKSINLFFPYLAGTQDEKMFRVVRDRERWFQIIMGEKYEVDEASTDRQAARVPLPADVKQQLSMRLHP